jgi:hypothetical protein
VRTAAAAEPREPGFAEGAPTGPASRRKAAAADKHLAAAEPETEAETEAETRVPPPTARSPRSHRDLDAIPDDYD